ncbi:MAG: hypothetical protein ABSD38_37135, partial [Syntrophorhabdales bacterium]
MVIEETLRLATDRLVEQFRPQRVILFGSQAMVAMDRAHRGVEVATDVIILTPEEFERDRLIPGTVARPAWREGRVLYE